MKVALAEARKAANARKAEIAGLEREHEELSEQEKLLSAAAGETAVRLGEVSGQSRLVG